MPTNPIIKMQKAKDRISRYQACFATPDGEWVLADLKKTLCRPSFTPGRNMPFSDVCFNEGVKYPVQFIESMLDPKKIERINKIMEKENE